MKAPLVSFIVLSYNYEKYIRKTIESVLGQTYKNLQLVIVDDGSSDESVQIIKEYEDPRIVFHQHITNLGAERAYRTAYELCNGEFIHPLDADDWIVPECTEIQLKWMDTHPEIDLVATAIRAINGDGVPMVQPDPVEEWGSSISDFNDSATWASQNYICHSSILIRKSAHEIIGLSDPDMHYAPDYDVWVRFHVNGFRFARLPEKLTYYRIHGNNQTHKNPEGTFLEKTYTFWRYLLPHLAAQSRFDIIAQRIHEIFATPYYAQMSVSKRLRLLTILTRPIDIASSYKEFLNELDKCAPNGGWVIESLANFSPLKKLYDMGEDYNKDLVGAFAWQIKYSERWRFDVQNITGGNDIISASPIYHRPFSRVLAAIRTWPVVNAMLKISFIRACARRAAKVLGY